MPASRKLGPYELVSPLAEGGMAEIFVARRAGIGGFEKQVALKVIHPNLGSDPTFVRMLVEEAKISVQLQHANIVQTYDLGCVDEEYYIAMELIDGVDLFKLLRKASEKNIDFPFEVAAFIAGEVSLGLDYAHRRTDERGRPLHIIHRDVSPQNVLLSRDGAVKIVDFGIAKAALRQEQTEAGVIKGKYYYMSPEQALGQPLDPRTDVFSTGILLYEMLVGQMLYLDDDMDRLLDKVRKARIPPPSGRRPKIPIALERLVMKALRRNREDRFNSSSELAQAIQQYLKTAAPTFGRDELARFVAKVLGESKTSPGVKAPERDELPRDEYSLLHSLPVREPEPEPEPEPPLEPRRRGLESTARVETTSPEKRAKLRGDNALGARRGPAPDPIARPAPPRAAPRTANEETRPASLPSSNQPAAFAPIPTATGGLDYDEDDHTIVDSGGETLIGERAISDEDRPDRRERDAPSSELRLPTAGATPLGDAHSEESFNDDSEATAIDRLAQKSRNPPVRPRSAADATNDVDLAYRSTMSAPLLSRAAAPTQPQTEDNTSENPTRDNPLPQGYADPDETRPMADGPMIFAAPQKNSSPPAPAQPLPVAQPLSIGPIGSAYGGSAETALPGSSSRIDLRGGGSKVGWILTAVALLSAVGVGVWLLLQTGAPATGSVQVVSAPPGAEVRLDGVAAADRSPLVLHNVDTRRAHQLTVVMAGYEPWETTVNFVNGASEVRLQAVLAPLVGRLEVSSLPAGAEVIVNGQVRGVTPATIDQLPRNEDLIVELRLRGYRAVRRTVSWGAQRAVALTVPLEKTN